MAADEFCTDFDRIVCHCLGITAAEIRTAVAEGRAECLRSVMRETGAGTGCTCCHLAIRALVAMHPLAGQCEDAASSPTCVTR